MSSRSLLEQFHVLDTASPKFHDQIVNVLHGEDYKKWVTAAQGNGLVGLVDYLDKVLDDLDRASSTFRRCLQELRYICGTKTILPTSCTLSSDLLEIGPDPLTSRGYGDVHEGFLNGVRVCIKRVRIYAQDTPQQDVNTFCQEAVTWKHLAHPNVVPLIGATVAPFQLVSNWMSGGDLPEYTKRHPDADRPKLLSDIANGLQYLHSCDVIHGDLRGSNILVDETGRACIADFGLATITQSLDSTRAVSIQRGNTLRWIAPEVLSGGRHSKEADVFSFAMVMIQVFTDAVPFSDSSPVTAMLAITQGRRPPRPAHLTFTGELWLLTQRCWDRDPHLRPGMSEVSQILSNVSPAWKRLFNHALTAHERISAITMIFSDCNQIKIMRHLSGSDAQTFIDMLDEALDGLPPQVRRRCLPCLYSICGRQALVPRSLAFPLCYDSTEDPLFHGGFADVWKGQHLGRDVAVKVLRLYPKDDLMRTRNRFCRKVIGWRALHHPNVLPLLGVTMTDTRLVMVSEWMDNGDISSFVKSHADVDRLDLLQDATRGLIYMHEQGIVHGDLTGANILIDNNGRARLAGFSLLTMALNQSNASLSTSLNGTIRWMSPELLLPEAFALKDSRPTKGSDCYALGMVIYEVLSGRLPFSRCNETAVVFKVLQGERPRRPRGTKGAWFTVGLWEMLGRCWKPPPDERLGLDAVLQCLQEAARPSRPFDIIEDVVTDVEDQSDAASARSSPSVSRREDRFLALSPGDSPHASMTGSSLPTSHSRGGLPAPRQGHPCGVPDTSVPPHGGKLLCIPQKVSLKGGWVGRLTHNVRRVFEVITSKFSGH